MHLSQVCVMYPEKNAALNPNVLSPEEQLVLQLQVHCILQMQAQTIKNNDDTDRQTVRLLFLSIGAANLFCVIFVESIPSKSHRSPHNKIAVILFSLVSSSCSHLTTLRAKRHLKNIIKCLEMIRVHGIKFCNNLLDFQLKMFTFLFLSEVHKSR